MFIPLHDGVALRHLKRPTATYALLGLNVLVFVIVGLRLLGDPDRVDLALGVIPAVLFGQAALSPDLFVLPAWMTLVTALFLHGGVFHLVGNMLFLWVFGDNVEDAMGTGRFVAFYLASGVAASLAFCAMAPGSESPLIGASGAVSGVVAAYLLLYPRVHVLGLVFQIIPVSVAAFWCIGAWILFQFGSALWSANADVGWWAHVGGLVAGAVLTPVLKRKDVPLFGGAA